MTAPLAETAVQQIQTAYETLRDGGHEHMGGVLRGATAEGAGDPRPAQGQVSGRTYIALRASSAPAASAASLA